MITGNVPERRSRMDEKDFDLQDYMTKGVERIVADALRATIRNPKESALFLSMQHHLFVTTPCPKEDGYGMFKK